MQALTGIRFKELDADIVPLVTMESGEHPLQTECAERA